MPGGAGPAIPLAKPKFGTGRKRWVSIFIVTFAAFGGFLFGYDTGYIAGTKAMPFWLKEFGTLQSDGSYAITTGDDSLVTSILSVGTCIGALAAYPIGDFMGRRFGLMFSCLVFSTGVAMQTASTTIPLFSAGRVFAGLGVGLVSCLVPMYQSECAPKAIRGAVVAGYQWAITWGLLVAACIVQGTKNMNGFQSYRIPIALQFVWAAVLCGGVFLLPESPRWLILKGRDDDAKRSLSFLLQEPTDGAEVQTEYSEIHEALELERAAGSISLLECFIPKEKRLQKTLTGMALQALQQLTGINFIIYYGTTFFQRSGVSNPFIATIAIDVVNVGMTVPGIICVDYLGRRSLLLIGAAGMVVCEFIVAICGTALSSSNQSGQKVLVGFSCIYIGFFAATWGPLAWVVTGEMFPLAMRAKGMSLTTFSNWILNFAIGYSTPYLVDAGHANLQSKVFFIWGSCCVFCFIFVYFCIHETKGLSLEQVEVLWANSTAMTSVKYRKQIIEDERMNVAGHAGASSRDAEKGEAKVESRNGAMET